jgi:hypothetical protein
VSEADNLADLYDRTCKAADGLQARAVEISRLPQRLEELTKDIPAWCAAARARGEARATLEQAEGLGRVLEELGERLGNKRRSTSCPLPLSVSLLVLGFD